MVCYHLKSKSKYEVTSKGGLNHITILAPKFAVQINPEEITLRQVLRSGIIEFELKNEAMELESDVANVMRKDLLERKIAYVNGNVKQRVP